MYPCTASPQGIHGNCIAHLLVEVFGPTSPFCHRTFLPIRIWMSWPTHLPSLNGHEMNDCTYLHSKLSCLRLNKYSNSLVRQLQIWVSKFLCLIWVQILAILTLKYWYGWPEVTGCTVEKHVLGLTFIYWCSKEVCIA
jgi:hypothetical protein